MKSMHQVCQDTRMLFSKGKRDKSRLRKTESLKKNQDPDAKRGGPSRPLCQGGDSDCSAEKKGNSPQSVTGSLE